MERLSTPEHWNMIYGKYERHQLGWYSPLLKTSLEWVTDFAPDPNLPIVDIGGGSSTLVDELLALHYSKLTLVDLSEQALTETTKRLGELAKQVDIICSDIRSPDLVLPKVALWHDRAAFHFLRQQEDIDSYKLLLRNTLEPDGIFVLGVFSVNAPERCSGLLVNRRTLEDLTHEFGNEYHLIKTLTEVHITPGKVEQEYIYSAWKRR